MPIKQIGVSDFERLLAAWTPRRRITEVHLHHTYIPDHAGFRGEITVQAMRRYHMEHAGMVDIAQHLTVDPSGQLWTGRPFDQPPASIRGRNGNTQAGPFAIEVVGNFDIGHDVFGGVQKNATLAVILALLRKFGLREKAIVFHRQHAPKSCPGTSIDRDSLCAEVQAYLDGREFLSMPPRSDGRLNAGEIRGWHRASRGTEDEIEAPPREARFAEVPEEAWMLQQQDFLAELMERDGASRALDFDVRPLLPHIINLSEGLLSTQGDVSSSVERIDTNVSCLRMIVDKHLADHVATHDQPHLLFHAHGGLVSEGDALRYARAMVPWWLAHGVYPIFFVWESSLLDTLRDSPRELGDARGKLGQALSEVFDQLVEGLTQGAARRIWAQMKEDAENASSAMIPRYGQAGGAYQFWRLLAPALQKPDWSKLKIHAVGHSTGPILLSRFLPLLAQAGVKVETLSYLAPAIRTDVFHQRVEPLLPGGAKKAVRQFTTYTMTDAAERDDNVAQIYRKSLLYFVRDACEDRDNGRVLGLQKDLLEDPALMAQFGVTAGSSSVSYSHNGWDLELSPPQGVPPQNPRTAANHHGDFDNDAQTMIAVLTQVLGHTPRFDRPEKQFPSDDDFNPPDDDPPAADRGGSPRPWRGPGSGGMSAFPEAENDAQEADAPAPAPLADPGTAGRKKPAGRRRAACIGINAYPERPLAGCVADSLLWAKTFRTLGFEITAIADKDCTRTRIVTALRDLVRKSRAGDELIFQYAGHGTQLPDTGHDESDAQDEALVPIDYTQGALFIDDDLYVELQALHPDATLTLFMDCCHSGSNSRVSPRPVPREGDQSRARFLPMNDAVKSLYRKARMQLAPSSTRTAEREALPGVVHFAACRDSEYAWESNGHGEFTLAATGALVEACRQGLSNQDFLKLIVKKMGAKARQRPMLLRTASSLQDRSVLGGP